MARAKKRAKRSNGEGSVYQRGNTGQWIAAWTHGGKRCTVSAPTAAEAIARRDERRAEQAAGGPSPKGGAERLSDFLVRWLDKSAPNTCNRKTLQTYRGLMASHVDGTNLGALPLSQITAEHISTWLAALRKKTIRKGVAGNFADGRPISASTVHCCWRALRAALNVAKAWRLVHENAASAVRMAKVPRASQELLSIEQARALLAVAAGSRVEALLTLAITTGMRKGELLGLRVIDFEPEAGRLQVRVQLQRVGAETFESEPKVGSRRSLLLPGFVVEVLQEHLRCRARDAAAVGAAWVESGRMFCSMTGSPLQARNLSRSFAALLKRAGLKLRFHDLRHSAATLLHVGGVPETAIQHLLGHGSGRTTREIYLHVVPKSERQAADKMSELIAKGA